VAHFVIVAGFVVVFKCFNEAYNPVFTEVLVGRNNWIFTAFSLLIPRFIPIIGIRFQIKQRNFYVRTHRRAG